ncbi:FecR family protein [Flavobacterium poyangense]|uniref:FecR family protein n=1 Tax=Flavobacterium poyangense TaxID=2204302 RepID=UPI001421C0DD|nr:FecR family protein [Flavobacterium sp. JXAS1]
MSNLQFQIDELIVKFRSGIITPHEHSVLMEWINKSKINREIFENLTNKEWVSTELDKMYEFEENAGWETIAASLKHSKKTAQKKRIKWFQMVAAVLLLALGIGSLFYKTPDQTIPDQNLSQKERFGAEIMPPVVNQAILTLSNGKKIIVRNDPKKELIIRAADLTLQMADDKVIHKNGTNSKKEVLNQNTLFVPKGSKPLQLILADGTKTWINAGSSLTFPLQFIGAERKLSMTGEVFFKVAKNKHMPFRVMANGTKTEALGTQFNINAYTDQPTTKITLVEGSIKVEKRNSKLLVGSLIVKPNQQVIAEKKLTLIKEANIEETTAWRDGQFYFEGADIKVVMNQISKWYDLDVVYKGTVTSSFVMKIAKDVPLSEILKIMEMTDLVRFKREGKKIIVMSYTKP